MPDKMENQIAVSVQNVTKSYRLFSSITERLKEVLHPFKKTYHRDFLALSGVSLEVKKGSVFGIIGRNGSGKSTLLQIICSVSQPTSGSVAVNGRISSLLSLGAGFNPEYTGRANVMFNGSLMGFTPSEMKERLPLIQSFADIGDFFDQPVKTYSSGMYVRLAFASAINVDPDILIIDEALAVGDARFQQKCYQKFNDFKDAGKTIILVTHDTGAVLTHCENAVLLDNGSIIENGHPKDVVNRYFDMLFGLNSAGGNAPPVAGNIENNNAAENRKNTKLDEFLSITPDSDNCFTRKNYNKNEYRYGDRKAEIIDYLVICGNETDSEKINSGDLVEIYYKVRFHHDMEKPAFGFSLHTIDGVVLYATNTWQNMIFPAPAKKSDVIIFKFSFRFNIHSGDHFLSLGAGELMNEVRIKDARMNMVHLHVLQNRYFDGLVDLETTIDEISRNSAGPMTANL